MVHRDSFRGRDIPFPDADPLSFRCEAGFHADKTHVWQHRLAENSPPPEITIGNRTINNREAIWEYQIVPGVDGANFTWFDPRWDTMFWTDKRRIYAHDRDLGLIPLPDVHASEFRMFGKCFGTDGKAVFCHAKRLPLNPDWLQTEGYFIWNNENVFMTANQVPLKGKDFRILGEKYVVGFGGGTHYRLADADTTIILGPNNTCLPDDPLF